MIVRTPTPVHVMKHFRRWHLRRVGAPLLRVRPLKVGQCVHVEGQTARVLGPWLRERLPKRRHEITPCESLATGRMGVRVRRVK